MVKIVYLKNHYTWSWILLQLYDILLSSFPYKWSHNLTSVGAKRGFRHRGGCSQGRASVLLHSASTGGLLDPPRCQHRVSGEHNLILLYVHLRSFTSNCLEKLVGKEQTSIYTISS